MKTTKGFLSNDFECYSEEFIEICSVQDLLSIQNDLSGKYRLMNDIDMQGVTFTEISEYTGGEGGSAFYGVLDGNGYTIENLTINELNSNSSIGFIEFNDGIIKNLAFSNITILCNENKYSEYDIGVFAGHNSGQIINCYCDKLNLQILDGSISHLNIGIISGCNNGLIKRCGAIGEISISMDSTNGGGVGGITGDNQTNGNIEECYNATTIKIDSCDFGGIAGNNEGIIANCYNMGALIKTQDNGRRGGGISAYTYENGLIKNCYSIGKYIATYLDENSISWSDRFYGISNSYYGGVIIDSFYMDRSEKYVYHNTSDERKSLIQLLDNNTYYNYDLVDVWEMATGKIPVLKYTSMNKACNNHYYDYSEIKQVATCTEAGKKISLCDCCGDIISESIPSVGHISVIDDVLLPTCTNTGLTEGSHCSVCREVLTAQEVIPSTGHTEVLDETVAATCTTTGLTEGSHCSVCNEILEKQASIPRLNHSIKTVIDKEATCGKVGSKHNECIRSGCSYKEIAVTIPATGKHTYDKYIVSKEATIFAEGQEIRVCKVCGEKEARIVSKRQGTIKLTTSSLVLQLKKSADLKAIVTGLATGDYVTSWKSSDTQVATIDSVGKVTAKKAGTTTITVTTAGRATASLKLKVQKKAVKTSSISGISSKITLEKGKKFVLNPIITPITTTDKLSFSSNNKKVVTVNNKTGLLTAKAVGTAKITVKSGGKKKTITVTVPGITNIKAKVTVKKKKTLTLKPKKTGIGGKFTYVSSNPAIATVTSNGKIKGISKGKAIITVQAETYSMKCNVIVK